MQEGTCLRAANFVKVGHTASRGHQDRGYRCAESVKAVCMYALEPNWWKRPGFRFVNHEPRIAPGKGLDNEVRRAREAAEAHAASEIEAFRAGYPERLAFEYRLDDDAADRPFLVEAMWHDGEFTYLRSRAQESPALYELRDGEPALVAYDLTEDGLYVARHVLDDGWLQIGDERASWRFVPRGTFR